MPTLDLLRKLADLIGQHPMPVTQAIVTGLTAQFLLAHTLAGHHDRLVRRAERWLRGGEPVAGFGTFRGPVVAEERGAPRVAPRHHEDPALSESALAKSAVVERVRVQRRTGKDIWRDVRVTSRADPFRLELAEGRELLVVPGDPQLSGFEETDVAPGEHEREVRSAVYPDEPVWVTGFLEPPPKGMGAYRGGGEARKLRPPKGKQLWITRQAPAEGWKRLARAHRAGGWLALGSLAAAIAIGYRTVLGPWIGGREMPHLPSFVLLAWAILAVVSVAVWSSFVKSAKNAWIKRFPWL